jgi:hypothetical protein
LRARECSIAEVGGQKPDDKATKPEPLGDGC